MKKTAKRPNPRCVLKAEKTKFRHGGLALLAGFPDAEDEKERKPMTTQQHHFKKQYFNEITPLLDKEFDERQSTPLMESRFLDMSHLNENSYLMRFDTKAGG
jgi:hypothetical protein